MDRKHQQVYRASAHDLVGDIGFAAAGELRSRPCTQTGYLLDPQKHGHRWVAATADCPTHPGGVPQNLSYIRKIQRHGIPTGVHSGVALRVATHGRVSALHAFRGARAGPDGPHVPLPAAATADRAAIFSRTHSQGTPNRLTSATRPESIILGTKAIERMPTVRNAILDLCRAHGLTTWFGNPGSSELSAGGLSGRFPLPCWVCRR